MGLLCGLLWMAWAAPPAGYQAEIEKWRSESERRLRAPDNWLSVAGLFWLREGENRFGSGAANHIVLPADAAPTVAGVFELRGGRTIVKAAPQSGLTLRGAPVTTAELRPDADILQLGRLSLFVIRRGERYGIRMKDPESRFRRNFSGRRWFPVKPEYLVEARFEPYSPPRKIRIPNVLGGVEEMDCPGQVVFEWRGKEYRLDPVDAGDSLWLIFRDRTSGKETYGAGRFLYVPKAREGRLPVDFNKAVNPPCAFTPYATCPLPPKQNVLPIRIEAGELTHHAE